MYMGLTCKFECLFDPRFQLCRTRVTVRSRMGGCVTYEPLVWKRGAQPQFSRSLSWPVRRLSAPATQHKLLAEPRARITARRRLSLSMKFSANDSLRIPPDERLRRRVSFSLQVTAGGKTERRSHAASPASNIVVVPNTAATGDTKKEDALSSARVNDPNDGRAAAIRDNEAEMREVLRHYVAKRPLIQPQSGVSEMLQKQINTHNNNEAMCFVCRPSSLVEPDAPVAKINGASCRLVLYEWELQTRSPIPSTKAN
jgi:hypothetical protein